MPGSRLLHLKGMRIATLQLCGFYYRSVRGLMVWVLVLWSGGRSFGLHAQGAKALGIETKSS